MKQVFTIRSTETSLWKDLANRGLSPVLLSDSVICVTTYTQLTTKALFDTMNEYDIVARLTGVNEDGLHFYAIAA